MSERCAKCGSEKIIPQVPLFTGHVGGVQAVVHGKPQALLFKDARHEVVTASVCGECGHMELRAANPGRLYEHYLRSGERGP